MVTELVRSSYRYHRGEVGGGPMPAVGCPSCWGAPCPPGLSRWVGRAGAATVLPVKLAWACVGLGGLGGPLIPALAPAEPGVLHHGDWGPQRGQVVAHQLPAEAAPQER